MQLFSADVIIFKKKIKLITWWPQDLKFRNRTKFGIEIHEVGYSMFLKLLNMKVYLRQKLVLSFVKIEYIHIYLNVSLILFNGFFSNFISDRMKKNCMRTTATQTDRSRNSAHITSPNSGSNPLQKSRQMSNYPQKVSDIVNLEFKHQVWNYIFPISWLFNQK